MDFYTQKAIAPPASAGWLSLKSASRDQVLIGGVVPPPLLTLGTLGPYSFHWFLSGAEAFSDPMATC